MSLARWIVRTMAGLPYVGVTDSPEFKAYERNLTLRQQPEPTYLSSSEIWEWNESEIVRDLRLRLAGKISIAQDRALGAAIVALAVQEGRDGG